MNFEKNIKEIEKKIGYTFKDKSLLRQAFTRTSYCNEGGRREMGYQSNEVLEFFGDGILSASIITIFLRKFSARYSHGIKTNFAEGDFTVIRSKLSDKKNLSSAVLKMGIQEFLLMGTGDARLGVNTEPSVMEDLFESIIGAVYIDSGMDMEKTISVVSGMLDITEFLAADGKVSTAASQSFKNQLQEWCADKKRRLPQPEYKTVAERGPEHKKVYERACYIGDRLVAVGTGKNQKAADADAAERALGILKSEAESAEVEKMAKKSAEALAGLRAYAKEKKLLGPEFKDIGESALSTPERREYVISCTLGGVTESAAAPDKATARAMAAEKVLIKVKPAVKPEPKSVKASGTKPVMKHNAKPGGKQAQMKKSLTHPKRKKGARG